MRGHRPGSAPSAVVPRRAPGRAAAPHPVLRLQAVAGNAAVTGMLQRAIDVQRQTVTNDTDFRAAVGRQEWGPAVGYLATLSPAAIVTLVKPLKLGVCESLLGHVRPDQHAVRGGLSECGFELAKGQDWVKAARFVSVLDDPGIDKNVATLLGPDLRRLAKGARKSEGGGDERLLRVIRRRLAATPGELFGKVRHQSTPTNGVKKEWYEANGPFFFRMEITFTPDADVVEASRIGFVQTVSMLTKAGDVAENRSGMKGRLASKKQGIDRGDKSRSGWFGQANDGSYPREKDPKLKQGVIPGSVIGGVVTPAEMVDIPDGTTANVTYTFETSIIAQEGTDEGLTYAVVKWSFFVDGDMKIHTGPVEVVDKPSADFGEAVGAWNKQAGPSPPREGQQRLPVFRRVEPASG